MFKTLCYVAVVNTVVSLARHYNNPFGYCHCKSLGARYLLHCKEHCLVNTLCIFTALCSVCRSRLLVQETLLACVAHGLALCIYYTVVYWMHYTEYCRTLEMYKI
jgi:hypothetical protein